MWHIYVLKHPATLEIRYVGKANNPRRRLATHRYQALKRPVNSHKENWLRSIYNEGLNPLLEIIESGDSKKGWIEAEQNWIKHCKSLGCRLVNASDGGEGSSGFKQDPADVARRAANKRGTKASPEHRLAISKGLTGRSLSKEQRERQSKSTQGRRYSDEVYAKGAAKRTGQKRSEAAKQKTAEALTGRTLPQDVKDKIAQSLRGRKLTPEHKAKVSAAGIGRVKSSATLEKMRINATGRKHTTESKAKMSTTKQAKKALRLLTKAEE